MRYILPLFLLLLMCSQSQAIETGNTEGNQLESPQSEGDEPGGSLVIERIERESAERITARHCSRASAAIFCQSAMRKNE